MVYTAKIGSIYNTFTRTEKRIAAYVIKESKKVGVMSITEFSEELGVGRASILRFCRKLGAEGYQDFKLKLLLDEYSTNLNIYNDPIKSGSVHSLIEEVTKENIATLNTSLLKVNEEAVKEATERIYKADKVVIFAEGISLATGIAAQYKFTKFGLNCVVPIDYHFQCFAASNLTEDSVIIIIDLIGRIGGLAHLVKAAKNKGVYVIAMVNYEVSQITEYADATLLTEATESPFKDGELTAMLSQINILDMIYTFLAKKKGKAHSERIKEIVRILKNNR